MKEKRYRLNANLIMVCLTIIVVILVVGGLILFFALKNKGEKPDIAYADNMTIRIALQNASELTTQEAMYTGLIKYDDKDIPFINQKKFSAIYTARVYAGIDVQNIKVDSNESKVTVTIPRARIRNVEILEDTIEFYDEKFALFDPQSREDTLIVIQDGKKEAEHEAINNGILEKADERATVLVTQLCEAILKNEKAERELEIITVD